jgi:hypothetical protein
VLGRGRNRGGWLNYCQPLPLFCNSWHLRRQIVENAAILAEALPFGLHISFESGMESRK